MAVCLRFILEYPDNDSVDQLLKPVTELNRELLLEEVGICFQARSEFDSTRHALPT